MKGSASAPKKQRVIYHNRAQVREQMGDYSNALQDYRSAYNCTPEHPLVNNNLAWALSTLPGATVANGVEAMPLAQKACELTGWNDAGYLDTLAAASARAGDYTQAAKWQSDAIAKNKDPRDIAEFQQRLLLYQQQKPYTEQAFGSNNK